MADIRVVIQKPINLIGGDVDGGHASSVYTAAQVINGGNA